MGLKTFLAAASVALVASLRSVEAFVTGHDLSSVGYMEKDKGVTWYNAAGQAQPVETILAAGGMQSVRLRLWTGQEYGLDYTLNLAKRFSKAGHSIFLDFHFSDTWADPMKQAIPNAWNKGSVSALAKDVRNHVASTLKAFTSAGVKLSIVSLGNEILNGFLFPLGKIENNNFKNFAQLWAAARAGVEDAVAQGTTRPKIMIHVNDGWKSDTMAWYFKGVFATGLIKTSDVDAFGVSFYPFFDPAATTSALATSLGNLARTYNKPIYVAETDYPNQCTKVKLSANYPASAQGQIQWTQAVMNVVKGLPNNLGAGVYYWEPAYVSTAGLGSACESALLFSVDWSQYPKTKAAALSSVALFKNGGQSRSMRSESRSRCVRRRE